MATIESLHHLLFRHAVHGGAVMFGVPHGDAAVAAVIADATHHLSRALSREGWDGPSRELCDGDIESWRRELEVVADSSEGWLPGGRGR